MSSADEAQQPRRVCLQASAALDAMRRHVGPQPTADVALTRRNLGKLGASDRLGDVVASLVGDEIEPDHVAHLNAQPERFQRDVLTVVRAAVAEGRGLDLDLRLTADGRTGTEIKTWYDDDGLHRALVAYIPPPP
jgi:hypothetical protein